jgi:hypothetical protein
MAKKSPRKRTAARKKPASRRRAVTRKKAAQSQSRRKPAARQKVAKRGAGAAPRRRARAARSAARAVGVCQLMLNPFDVSGPTGGKVALAAKAPAGQDVVFVAALYDGKPLIAANKSAPRIEFDVKNGRKILQMIFSFTAGTAGRGELVEDCGAGASQTLRPLAGHEPNQFLEVIGV